MCHRPEGLRTTQNGPSFVLWLYAVGSLMGNPAVVAQVVEREFNARGRLIQGAGLRGS